MIYQRCGRCCKANQVYCCRSCQRNDWKEHKLVCFTPTEVVARKTSVKETKLRACNVCSKSPRTTGKPLMSCSECRQVYYCSDTCQYQDWNQGGHKTMCLRSPANQGGGKPKKLPLNRAQLRAQDEMVSIQRCQASGDKVGEGEAYLNLGYAYFLLSKHPRAIEYTTKALELFREMPPGSGEAEAFYILGQIYNELGEFEKAQEMFTKYLTIARRWNEEIPEGLALKGLGDIHCQKGELKQALKVYTRCIRIFVRLGELRLEANAQCGLGNTYLQMGRLEKAMVCFKKDLALTPEDERAATYGSLALLYKTMGNTERAMENHHKVISLVKESGDRDGERRAYLNLGIAYEELGVHDLAKSYLEKARTIQQELGVP